MANVKSDRKKKLVKAILIIALLVVITIVGKFPENEGDNTGTENATLNQQTSEKDNSNSSETTQISTVDGEMILTMIDVGQADSFLLE